jgi:Thylakoid formation protein
VNARFQRDPIWSAGILLSIDLLLKNYPERDVGEKIASALFTSVGLDEGLIRAEATEVIEWARGKTKEEVASALRGEGDSAVAKTAQLAKVRVNLSRFRALVVVQFVLSHADRIYFDSLMSSGCIQDTLDWD